MSESHRAKAQQGTKVFAGTQHPSHHHSSRARSKLQQSKRRSRAGARCKQRLSAYFVMAHALAELQSQSTRQAMQAWQYSCRGQHPRFLTRAVLNALLSLELELPSLALASSFDLAPTATALDASAFDAAALFCVAACFCSCCSCLVCTQAGTNSAPIHQQTEVVAT